MTVEAKIRTHMDTHGVSQTWLSKATCIPLPKLNLCLNGKRKMTFAEYELVCGALQVEASAFLKPRNPDIARPT